MPAQVVHNNMEVDGPIVPPTKPDGTGYRYCMYFSGDTDVAFADTETDLLAVLIPGYSPDNPTEAAVARIRLAETVAARIQAMVLVAAPPEVDAALTDTERAALLAPRGGPQPDVPWWSSPVPLVVVETSYQPFTDVPRPASAVSATADADNLWWIRPADEEDFLVSLHEVGFIRLMESTHP